MSIENLRESTSRLELANRKLERCIFHQECRESAKKSIAPLSVRSKKTSGFSSRVMVALNLSFTK